MPPAISRKKQLTKNLDEKAMGFNLTKVCSKTSTDPNMISTAALFASLLLPCYASFGTQLLRAAQDPTVVHPTAAPSVAPLVTKITPATQERPARFPHGSTWRRLDEELTECGFVDFTTHLITNQAVEDPTVVVADLDGDSDLDVLYYASGGDEIGWYENLNGAGNFSGPWLIATAMPTHHTAISSVAVADVDGDGDLDVLSVSWGLDWISWYENLDGTGDFSWPPRELWTHCNSLSAIAAADLDGDADLDIVLGSNYGEHRIVWYENLDGAGNFSGPMHLISTEVYVPVSVAAADLDGDGDLDVLSISKNDDNVAWYENLGGNGDFSGPQRVITTQADGAVSFATADLDGDGDLDVVSTSSHGDRIDWYENLDGAGHFSWPPRVVTIRAEYASRVDYATSVGAADFDGDGDLDVFYLYSRDGTIGWCENVDGFGDFSGPQRVIATQTRYAISVAAADLDGDGDIDVLSGSSWLYGDEKITWYENECRPMTPQPTPEPTYWGPQVFGNQPQTTAFERLCVAWCLIFGVISVIVLGYVVLASPRRDWNLARIIFTIVLSHYDYGSDTLFIGFQNFVTPALFVAAVVSYLLPLAFFIVIYRRVIGMHLVHMYRFARAKTIVRFDSWDQPSKALTEIGSFVIFPFAVAMLTFAYLMLLFVFISCKLMSISFFAVKFFEAGGLECAQETFEVMFKRNILSELVFESSGELIIVLVDHFLRARQDFRSNTDLSLWAVLSIVGSSLMLVVEVWPYLYHIVWMGRGINAGIAAISTHLKFTPEEDVTTWLTEQLSRLAELFAGAGDMINDSNQDHSIVQIRVHEVKIIELPEQRER